MKGVKRFGKKGKLSLCYIGPYKILSRYDNVAYEFELMTNLVSVHPVFHVSLLKKCIEDPALIISLKSVGVKDRLSYDKVPVEILDR